jgi:PUA domain protein
MPAKRRYRLRKDELKNLVREVGDRFGGAVAGTLGKEVEIQESEEGIDLIISGGRMLFFRKNGLLFPTLKMVDLIQLKRVAVDMGAVPHVVNGADVMSPGIVSADPKIKAGDVVVVVDERHGKPLAIGLALLDGSAMRAPKGKAVKNIHHVGDEIWRLLETR